MSENKASINVSRNMRGLLTSGSNGRYPLDCVQVLPSQDGVLAVASNGHAIAVTRFEGRTDAPRLMPGALLPRKGVSTWIEYRDNIWRRGVQRADAREGRFPPWQECLVDPDQPLVVVRINAKSLRAIARSIDNDENVVLLIPAVEGRTALDGIGVLGKDGVGMLMQLDDGDSDAMTIGRYRHHYRTLSHLKTQ